jgi:hypothetical protein
MVNSIDVSSLKETNQRIREAHDKIFDVDPLTGQVKRVKFESPQLKYELSEFFENVPSFNEQIPCYDYIDFDEIQQVGLQDGSAQIKPADMTKRQIDEMNNAAL